MPVAQVREFEQRLLAHVHEQAPDVLRRVADTGKLDDETNARLKQVIADFRKEFAGQAA